MSSGHVYDGEEPKNQESVILRSIVGNPNRHTPLAQHPPPTSTTTTPQNDIPASMYTLETTRQPIPAKVLPKSTVNSRLTSAFIEEQPPVTKKAEEDTPLYVEHNVLNHVKEEPTVFLEPKIISQPILYSIVGAKNHPIRNEQPIPIDEQTPQPVFYAATGQPNRQNIDVNTITLNVPKPIIDRSPILYSLVGGPRLQVRIQEPIKEESEKQQQPPPLLHSIVGNPISTPRIPPPDAHSLVHVQKEPILYSVVGEQQVPTNMPAQTRPAPVKKQTNTLIPVPLSQPTKTSSIRPSPILYAIVGGTEVPVNMPKQQRTALAPIKQQGNTFVSLPSTQPVEYSPVQPFPVLYTIVGETEVPRNTVKEDRPPVAPVKKQTNTINMYKIVGDPRVPSSIMTLVKTQQASQPVERQTSSPIPSFYPLVGKPESPSEENMVLRPMPPSRRSTPPRSIVPARRVGRSLDRQTAPDPSTNGLLSPQKQKKRRAKSREPTIPKSETVFIPLSDDERLPQIKQPRVARRKRSYEQIHRKPFTIVQYGPLQLSDYISPYAYRPSEPYRERTYKATAFPIMRHPRSDYRTIQSSYPFHYGGVRKRPHHLSTPRSLERDLASTRQRDRLWDYENQAQTDYDDDDRDNLDSSRMKHRYRRFRPRTPWIPVW